ncbi:ThiF family adenylyltransferase [Sphingobium xenophagum]|uniref:ThiF family adenylyltransferase n=1 Tax=Sphingobium xenophagum TaxID=121428 RepID=UPI00241E256C|nr:ThiF family adenylyltransferase [Sphingobium xenophagum]
MSRALFSRNADLAKLREEGYFVQVVGGFLVMREIPYVDANRKIRRGTLISSLALAGDQTRPPDTHVIHFDGDYPCFADGTRIAGIANQTMHFDLGHGLTAKHAFSSKPEAGYRDYHHKMTTYASILAGPAAVLDAAATPRPYRALEGEEEGDRVFNYIETASDRVGIGALTARLAGHRIAIIGLGGSGSYILDMVAKTPVAEIRLFDCDEFLQHNAFRAPGAPSLEELREAPLKVEYFKAIYGRMHRGITAVAKAVTADNLDLLDGIDFAFLSLDAGEAKPALVARLHERGIAFVDIGMGLELGEQGLSGILRVTTSTPATRGAVGAHARIPLVGGGAGDIYASNIQVADLNALNAVMAVIKWKKLCGFYCDLEREHHSTYTLDGNMLLNEDQA